MALDYSLLGPPANPAAAFQFGLQNGQAQRRDMDTSNALSALAVNPDDQNALSAFARANPEGFMQYQDHRSNQAIRQEQLEIQRATAQRAAQGDIDKRTQDGFKAIGNAALKIVTLPPEARAGAWDAAIDQLDDYFPGLTRYRGSYSPEALESVLAQSGLTDKAIELTSPKYQAIVPGGQLQNTNPYANVQMGQAPQGPQPGTVEDGYRFKGGNPADPNAWEPEGGAGSGPRNFP